MYYIIKNRYLKFGGYINIKESKKWRILKKSVKIPGRLVSVEAKMFLRLYIYPIENSTSISDNWPKAVHKNTTKSYWSRSYVFYILLTFDT